MVSGIPEVGIINLLDMVELLEVTETSRLLLRRLLFLF